MYAVDNLYCERAFMEFGYTSFGIVICWKASYGCSWNVQAHIFSSDMFLSMLISICYSSFKNKKQNKLSAARWRCIHTFINTLSGIRIFIHSAQGIKHDEACCNQKMINDWVVWWSPKQSRITLTTSKLTICNYVEFCGTLMRQVSFWFHVRYSSYKESFLHQSLLSPLFWTAIRKETPNKQGGKKTQLRLPRTGKHKVLKTKSFPITERLLTLTKHWRMSLLM